MILENVKVQWAKLTEANAGNKYMSEEKEYSIDIILSDEKAQKWVDSGLSPKLKERDGVKYIVLRKDLVWKKSGDKKKPPVVVDTYGKPLDVLIGNNSTVNVQFTVREWEFQGQKGKTAEIVAVQVLDLVEFTGGSDSVEFTFAEEPIADLSADDNVPF